MELKIGDILKGKIVKLIKIGVFVDIGEGKTGFVHISELSDKYINLPSDVAQVNDVVDVKVIKIENDKIGLSIKQVFNKQDSGAKFFERRASGNKSNNSSKNKVNKSSQKQFKNKEEEFEDMMKKFKTTSEQKLSDLKKYMSNKQRRSKNR